MWNIQVVTNKKPSHCAHWKLIRKNNANKHFTLSHTHLSRRVSLFFLLHSVYISYIAHRERGARDEGEWKWCWSGGDDDDGKRGWMEEKMSFMVGRDEAGDGRRRQLLSNSSNNDGEVKKNRKNRKVLLKFFHFFSTFYINFSTLNKLDTVVSRTPASDMYAVLYLFCVPFKIKSH